MPVIKKILSIVGIVVTILFLLFIIFTIWMYYHEKYQVDPHLVFSSSFWSGMCHADNIKEIGGCYSEVYLYDSGKYISTGYWEGSGNQRIDRPRVEKELGQKVIDKVIKTIRDSGIMSKDCPDVMTVDAGWDYELQLDGQKKRFINRPMECQPTLEKIDQILMEAVNAK